MSPYHTIRSIKEMNDANIIDTGVKSILDFGKDELVPHFIYCGSYYFWTESNSSKLREIFLTKMKRYGIQSAIFTVLFMSRVKP